ncbi:hypothetical protein FKP32DRAFT_1588923 [Trametes sanguinea]|nr:hypothetical protein FKP32DRAFT_1588923 [Trametes sanguinea]
MSDPDLGFGAKYQDLFSAATQPTMQARPPIVDVVSSAGPASVSPQPASTASGSSTASPPSATPESTKLRKRIRPKIALAPDQPPTARGNDRIRVYVACHECRARKIRCDGAKPVCFQCQKRPTESGACTYDAAPNRKGHDRRRKAQPQTAQTSAFNASKRRRTAAGDINPPPRPSSDESPSGSDSEERPSHSPTNERSTSGEPGDDYGEDAFNHELEDLWEYDPFAFDINNPELFQVPLPVLPSPPSSQQGEQGEDEDSIPSRPSVRFSRDTWWDALLTFYSSEHDAGVDLQTIALTSDQRNGAMRRVVSDLRALFQSAATWMSFIHLPRFFEQVLNPSRRVNMQPSLLYAALALGTLTQSSEIERGKRGREMAMRLVDMAHGAMQSSLATGWVDVGLAQAAWMLLYFELNTHPAMSWERSQSAMTLLDSLVRLFSLTTIDAGYLPANGKPLTSTGLGFDTHPMFGVAPSSLPNAVITQSSFGTAPFSMHTGIGQAQQHIGGLPQHHQRWEPQPNPRAFDPPMPNPFYTTDVPHHNPAFQEILQSGVANIAPASGVAAAGIDSNPYNTHSHAHRPQRGCNCAQFSLGNNWSSVKDMAPTWTTTIMWPTNLSEAEFSKEECRRLVWGSVMLIANLNAYASITPRGILQTAGLFVREYENFALLTPSETLVNSGTPMQGDDVWSLSLRAMLLLLSCLRVRASTTMSGAQRAEFAVRAWLEIDDLERRMERHTCGMSSNYGFQSMEMLFSLRIIVSYEFQRFIPQVTTAGNALFYRNKAEVWIQHLRESAEQVFKAFRAGEEGDPELNHRKSLFIFWLMSGIKKCLLLWEADPTLLLALTTACQTATYLEHVLLFWPCDRVRQIWQNMRYNLLDACKQAGVPPPSSAVPRPLVRREPAAPPTVSAG